jgi:internalin A
MARDDIQDKKHAAAYRTALEQIHGAEQMARSLVFSDRSLAALPPEIGQCVMLRQLYLQGNELATLPAEIGQCRRLVGIFLHDNRLTTLPPEIGQCTRLEELFLQNNRLTALPPDLENCARLRILYLHGNPALGLPSEILGPTYDEVRLGKATPASARSILRYYFSGGHFSTEAQEKILLAAQTGDMVLNLGKQSLIDLSPEIAKCQQLRALHLHDNSLTELPPEIGRCARLQELDIRKNYLTALPPQIGQCADLRELYAETNHLTTLPPEIGQCKQLRVLWLQNNRLRSLPPELEKCTALQVLYLHGNPALGLPPEVLGPAWEDVGKNKAPPSSARAILDYYFSRRADGGKLLNEVKLVLVGRGGVGKTSLVERLVRNRFEPQQAETTGVNLCDWPMTACPGGAVLAHVWDFAGQTITHAMHQFFLSVRTVYVLVLTGRESSAREDAEYWLRLIAAYGTDTSGNGPPVIIALNKWDDAGSARARVDRRALRERYPFIVEFVETDCATETGITRLRHLLHTTVDTLAWVRAPFPGPYWDVKNRLERVENPYLPYDAFRRLCQECGVVEEDRQDLLAENLHALGVALNFRKDERLQFASVLKPHWLTEHVYALVRHPEANGGVLPRAALPAVLNDEPDPHMRQFLVDMMVRFELAYPLGEEDKEAAAWLVPQALPDSQPQGVESFREVQDSTRLRYTYRALPVSIVPRFIVRTHPFIEGELRWASGVVLMLDGARGLVRADYAEKQVEIIVTGPAKSRRELAGLIQREFRYINGQIAGLNPTEETAEHGDWVPLHTLERDEAANRKTGLATAAGTVEMDPATKLNEFSAPAARDASWKPRVFTSYSHADEPHRKRLELYLKVLATHGALHEKWDDRKIQPGEDWDKSIKRELEEADVVLLLVSTTALASDYIHTVEMKRALARVAAGETVMIPVILEDCHWKLPELSKLQALPAGARPVREWTPQAKGWKNVSDGLLTVFQHLREARRESSSTL